MTQACLVEVRVLAQSTEKFLEQSLALLFSDSSLHHDTVVQSRVRRNVEN